MTPIEMPSRLAAALTLCREFSETEAAQLAAHLLNAKSQYAGTIPVFLTVISAFSFKRLSAGIAEKIAERYAGKPEEDVTW